MKPLLSKPKTKAWRASSLPDIVIVAGIQHPEHPLGRYVPEKNQIQFSASEMSKYEPEVQRFAIAHEIGHWLCVVTFPEDYPKERPESERFPDAFAKFFLRRQDGDENFDLFDEILNEKKFLLLAELAEDCRKLLAGTPGSQWGRAGH